MMSFGSPIGRWVTASFPASHCISFSAVYRDGILVLSEPVFTLT